MARTFKEKTERFEFAMDEDMRLALRKLSAETRCSVPFLVRRILGDYLVAHGYMTENNPFGNRILPP